MTGVQTCALPISLRAVKAEPAGVANFFVAARSKIAGDVISVMPGNVRAFEPVS